MANHKSNTHIQYRGRFAPSPSGPLHFGSLVAALGSWVDARANKGEWLVRIEDIDPPREVKGAIDDILISLEMFGLNWDQEILYQSSRLDDYQAILEQLINDGLVYRCICTRKEIKASGGIYQNTCRALNISEDLEHSLRLKVINPDLEFTDCFQGRCKTKSGVAHEDFILKRKDGLFAYMLAVVLDDVHQQISHVIRGSDLIDTTIQQINLFKALNKNHPIYGHLPVAVDRHGLKLSKQNHAQAVMTGAENVSEILHQCLEFLKQSPPNELKSESKEVILSWATQHWRPDNFKDTFQIVHNK